MVLKFTQYILILSFMITKYGNGIDVALKAERFGPAFLDVLRDAG